MKICSSEMCGMVVGLSLSFDRASGEADAAPYLTCCSSCLCVTYKAFTRPQEKLLYKINESMMLKPGQKDTISTALEVQHVLHPVSKYWFFISLPVEFKFKWSSSNYLELSCFRGHWYLLVALSCLHFLLCIPSWGCSGGVSLTGTSFC